MQELSIQQVTMLLQQTDRLTPDQFATIIRKNKPYLIKIEEEVAKIGYGELDIKITVRASVVEKMQFYKAEQWLRPKQEPLDPNRD